jgi:2-oxoisovalerate dehydrogenase E1 component
MAPLLNHIKSFVSKDAVGAEIAAWISEEFFRYLDALVMRLGSMDTAVLFAPRLEKEFLPQSKIGMKLQEFFGC